MARKQAISRPIVLPEEPVKWARFSRLTAVAAHGALSAVKLIHREPPEALELLRVYPNQAGHHTVKVLFARARCDKVRSGARNAGDFDDKFGKWHWRKKSRRRSVRHSEGFCSSALGNKACRSQRNHSAAQKACHSKRQAFQNARLQRSIRRWKVVTKIISDTAGMQPLSIPPKQEVQVAPPSAGSSALRTSIWSVQGLEGGQPRKRSWRNSQPECSVSGSQPEPSVRDSHSKPSGLEGGQPRKQSWRDSQPEPSVGGSQPEPSVSGSQPEPSQPKPSVGGSQPEPSVSGSQPVSSDQWISEASEKWRNGGCMAAWKNVVSFINQRIALRRDKPRIRLLLTQLKNDLMNDNLPTEENVAKVLSCLPTELRLLSMLIKFVLMKDALLRDPALFNEQWKDNWPSDETFASLDRIRYVIAHLNTQKEEGESLAVAWQGCIVTTFLLGKHSGLEESTKTSLEVLRRVCVWKLEKVWHCVEAHDMTRCFTELQKWAEDHQPPCPIDQLKLPVEEITEAFKAAWKSPPDCTTEAMLNVFQTARKGLLDFANKSIAEQKQCRCRHPKASKEKLHKWRKFLNLSSDVFVVEYLAGLLKCIAG